MFVLFRPQIGRLLIERDQTVARWQAEQPDTDVFEDRRLVITSSATISLMRQIEWLDKKIDPPWSGLPVSTSCGGLSVFTLDLLRPESAPSL